MSPSAVLPKPTNSAHHDPNLLGYWCRFSAGIAFRNSDSIRFLRKKVRPRKRLCGNFCDFSATFSLGSCGYIYTPTREAEKARLRRAAIAREVGVSKAMTMTLASADNDHDGGICRRQWPRRWHMQKAVTMTLAS